MFSYRKTGNDAWQNKLVQETEKTAATRSDDKKNTTADRSVWEIQIKINWISNARIYRIIYRSSDKNTVIGRKYIFQTMLSSIGGRFTLYSND